MKTIIKYLLLFVSVSPTFVQAENQEPKIWGIAMGVRSAEIPYASEIDTVNDVIPLMYYDNEEYFFLRGLTAGFRFYQNEKMELSAIGRYRYFDIPAEFQNAIQGNAVDLGLQYKYKFNSQFNTELELMNDRHGRSHANITGNYRWSSGNWELFPSARLRWKSDSFNNYYYGLGIDTPGSGFDLKAGLDVRYHVASNFYLIGRAALTALENDVTNSSVISRNTQSEVYLGIAFFNDRKKPTKRRLKAKPYVRFAHGWATPTNIGDILKFKTEKDPYNNQLSSVFYGLPLSDTLLTLPISIYMTPGIVYHHSSEVQGNFPEYVLGIKAYYTFKFPVKFRFGFAEGLSYTTEITYIEASELDNKGYRPSKLLNYLDVSFDVNLGDMFSAPSIKDLWLGYSIHHRSGIFQTSSAFGRIKGGSNYNSIYLQYHW